MDVSKEERFARYQELYDRGGFALWIGNFSDSFTSREAADEVAEFLAGKIRERVKDPAVAETLIPKITPDGSKTGDDLHDLDLDIIIYATGLHSITGELLRMDIHGEGGRSLQEHWSDGPKTNLGVQFSGFPNLFAIKGPHNPAFFCNITRCVESNVEWIVACIRYLRENCYETIAATVKAEEAWTQRGYDSAQGLLTNEMQDSWFFGSTNPENVRGRFLLFAGGVPQYPEIFADVVAKGYEGFELK